MSISFTVPTSGRVLLILFAVGAAAPAQEWAGSSTTQGPIFRNGNVGIGTNTPATDLHVHSTAQTNLLIGTTSEVNYGYSRLQFGTSTTGAEIVGAETTRGWDFLAYSNAWATTEDRNDLDISYVSRGSKKTVLYLDSKTGNVGVGISNASQRLHISGPKEDRSSILLDNTGSGERISHVRFQAAGKDVAEIRSFNSDSVTRLAFRTADRAGLQTRMSIDEGGYVGIGTPNPSQGLEISADDHDGSSILLDNTGPVRSNQIEFRSESTPMAQIRSYANKKGEGLLSFKTARDGVLTTQMNIDDSGNVGIGTYDTKGYKLAVDGKVIAEEVKVELSRNWPDFVFDQDYDLMSLDRVEDFARKHRRLPGVPGRVEVEEQGLALGDMQATLLRKIEELTLYVIAQDKKIDRLTARLEQLDGER